MSAARVTRDDFFEGVRTIVRIGLNGIEADPVKKALSEARKSYTSSDLKSTPNQNGIYRGGDAGSLFKVVKAIVRIPADEKITDENVIPTLHSLLSDWGGSDLASLKYKLFKALFPIRPARSDMEAERYVNIFKEEVNRLIHQVVPFTGAYITLGK